MKYYKRFASVAFVLALLTLAAFIALRSSPVDASTVIGYQSVELFDGDTAYTETTYSSAYLVGGFGEIVLQIHDDISGTTAITVTPQFSSESVACSAVTNWVDASVSMAYADAAAMSANITVSTLNTNTLTTTVASLGGGTSLTYGTVDVQAVITGDDAETIRFETGGRCMRVKIATGTTFTPTIYAWMVNTQ